MRQWMSLCEALGMPKISVRDVNARLNQIARDGERATISDIRFTYDSIMRGAEFRDNKMVIYRGMNIEEPEWFDNLAPGDNLGRYWAYDQQGAIDGSWDKPNIIFTALVDPKLISWASTIAQNMVADGEYEITLGGVQVTLLNVELRFERPIDLSYLIGQQFLT